MSDNTKDYGNPYRNIDETYPNLAAARDGVEKEFAKGGMVSGDSGDNVPAIWRKDEWILKPKKKHRIVMDNGDWVMNKKTLQDLINGSYNGR